MATEHPQKLRARELAAKEAPLRDELFLAVGRALTEWSILEEALCSIYILALCIPHANTERAAGSSFWAIATFDGKLKMTKAAVEHWFSLNEPLTPAEDAPLRRTWAALSTATRDRSGRRHDLAHGTVVSRNGFAWFMPSHFKKTYAKPKTSLAKIAKPPPGSLSRTSIDARTLGFIRMTGRLRCFEAALYEHLGQRGAIL